MQRVSGRIVCGGLIAAVAVAAMAMAAAVGVAAAAPGTPVAAVWRERHIDFVYLGRTARYSCDGLHDKVRALLLDLGARRDLRIATIGCQGEGRLRVNSPQPSLSIVFSAPALPDTSARPLRAGDLAATNARFESFTLAGDAFRNMGIGDCELVAEFTRQILPKLVTRQVKQDVACLPQQPSDSRFWVRGEILKTLPRVRAP